MASKMVEQYKCEICESNNDVVEVARQRCSHIVCWKCLSEHVQKNLGPKIKCPISDCSKFISDYNIRKCLSEEGIQEYEKILCDVIRQKQKCLLPDCTYIYFCNEKKMQFDCPNCSLFNCVSCKAAHKCLTCDQYKTIDEAEAICENEIKRAKLRVMDNQRLITREMLKNMDYQDIFVHDTLLECENCCCNLTKEDVIVLRCFHIYCRFCLVKHINATNIPIICPSTECKKLLLEREIVALLSKEQLNVYIDKCNSSVKGKLDLIFQCQTADCLYFVTYSNKPDKILCPLCSALNCTKCFAIHTNETCEQFKERIKSTPYGKSLIEVEEKIKSKEWMRCLKCNQLLKKISGCSWIQCISCKFEMCWALQMRRWGPNGRGDESDGCKCKLMGPRCCNDCESCEPHNGNHEENPIMRDLAFQQLLLHFLELILPQQ